jgi:hypothetical protein
MATDTQISFRIPAGWQTRDDRAAGILLRARPPGRPGSGVPPEIVLRSEPVDDDLHTWRREALTALALQLHDFDLEDEDDYRLAAAPARYHRFGHTLGVADLITEQWSWLAGGVGVTLTCTVERGAYIDYCELFEDVAASVEVLCSAA